MNPTNKEAYLISQGRKQETIDFVKKCNVSKENLTWFVTRLEKDNIDIEEKDLKDKIKKISKLIKASPDTRNMNNFEKVYEIANKYFEDENDIDSRKLYKFKDGTYILNLSEKELEFEANDMSNCVRDYKNRVKNKELAILAIKDKNNKTLAHFEISNLGFLRQHYGKANCSVKYSIWKYINDFFDKNKDEEIFNKLKENGFSAEYNIKDFHKNIPIVEYYIPISRTKSILSKKERVQEMLRVKDFINTNKDKNTFDYSYTAEEAIVKLKEYSKNITDMIESMSQAIMESSNNLFILNDNMIQKIFNKKSYSSSEEKLHCITSAYSGNYRPMNFDYIHNMVAEEPETLMENREEAILEMEVEINDEVHAPIGNVNHMMNAIGGLIRIAQTNEFEECKMDDSKSCDDINMEEMPLSLEREYDKNECIIETSSISEEYTINVDKYPLIEGFDMEKESQDSESSLDNCELSITKEEFIDLRNNN